MSKEIGDLLELVTAGEWGNNQGTPGGVDTGVIRSANFTKDHQFNAKEIVVRSIEEHKRQKKLLRKGDILIEKSGGSPDQPVGRVLFYDLKGEHTCSNFISILRPSKHVEAKFLYYSLCNLYEKGVVRNYQQQTTGIINLRLGEYLRESIYLPPLPEQKKIAEILSGIDLLIERQSVEIDKVSKIYRIACQQKISDLGRKSEIVTIGSISNKIMDYRGKSPPKHERGVPLITAKNIRKGFIEMSPAEFIQEDLYEEWMVKGTPGSGDILVTTEAPLGNVAMAPSSKFAIGQRIICISPNRERVTSEYLLACMKTDDFQGQLTASSTGSTVSGVRQGVLLNCNIPLAEIAWQTKIGSFDLNASKLITALTAKKEKLVNLKHSLTSDLLSGRKRVTL